ncbi:MAG TPA: hypothetical protein VF669_13620 [Tepidisphaeraceae bacterium]
MPGLFRWKARQLLDRTSQIKDPGIGVNVHRESHVSVTHERHRYTGGNAALGE